MKDEDLTRRIPFLEILDKDELEFRLQTQVLTL